MELKIGEARPWPALGNRIKRRVHQGTQTRPMLRRDREGIRQRALTCGLNGLVHRACLRQTSALPRQQERWSFCAPHVAKSTCNNSMGRWRAVTSGDWTNQQRRSLKKSPFLLGEHASTWPGAAPKLGRMGFPVGEASIGPTPKGPFATALDAPS